MNIARLIKTAPHNYIIYCDLRKLPLVGRYLYGNEWLDLRFFSFTLEGYNKYFRNRVDSLRDTLTRSSEHDLYKVVEEALRTDTVIPRFKIQPIVAGYSGFTNSDYRQWKYKLKNLSRSFLRRTIPWLWL